MSDRLTFHNDPTDTRERVFLGCPTYNGGMTSGMASSFFHTAVYKRVAMNCVLGASLIPASCNRLWCHALNLSAEHRIRWFAMLHADIDPEIGWLDKLIDIADEHGADMLSACVPIKDDRGLTSTAIASRNNGHHQFGRITQAQLNHPDFPVTFDINACADALESLPEPLRVKNVPRVGLRLNTGCMIVRCDQEWSPRVWFENVDGIEQRDGVWAQWDISEDWRFSWRVQNEGGKLMATKAIKLRHIGNYAFCSENTWGLASDCSEQRNDTSNAAKTLAETAW